MRNLIKTRVRNISPNATSAPSDFSSVCIGDNKFVEVYENNVGNTYVNVITVDADGYATYGSAVSVGVSSPTTMKIIKVATDKIAILTIKSGDARVRIGTISGMSVSLGTSVVFSTSMANGNYVDGDYLSEDKFAIFYSGSVAGQNYVSVATVSGTVPTFGTEVQVDNSANALTECDMKTISTDKMVIAYRILNNLYTRVVSISGTTPSFGTVSSSLQSAYSSNDDSCRIATVDTDKFAIIYIGTSNYPTLRVCTVSGTTITLGAEKAYSTALASGRVAIASTGTDRIIFTFVNNNTAGVINGYAAKISGTTVLAGDPFEIFSNDTGGGVVAVQWIGLYPVSYGSNHRVVFNFDFSNAYLNEVILDAVFDTSSVVDSWDETHATGTVNMYSGSYIKEGQSFSVIDATQLDSVKFHLKKFGSPTGNAVVTLYEHSGTFGTSSVPTGTALATSDTFDVSTLTGTSQLIEFLFSGLNNYIMGANTKYVIALEYSGGNASNYIQISTGPGASGNESKYISSWSANASDDLCFYVYGTPISQVLGPEVVAYSGAIADNSLSVVEVNTNKFVASYLRSDGTYMALYARCATIADGVITLGTEKKVSALTTNLAYARACKIDTDKIFWMACQATTSGTANLYAGTISGTTITSGSTTTMSISNPNGSSLGCSVTQLSTNKVFIGLHNSEYDSTRSEVAIANISGTTVSITGQQSAGAPSDNYDRFATRDGVEYIAMDATHVIGVVLYGYWDNGTSGAKLRAGCFTIAADVITNPTWNSTPVLNEGDYVDRYGISQSIVNGAKLSPSSFIVTMSEARYDYTYAWACDLTGTTVTNSPSLALGVFGQNGANYSCDSTQQDRAIVVIGGYYVTLKKSGNSIISYDDWGPYTGLEYTSQRDSYIGKVSPGSQAVILYANKDGYPTARVSSFTFTDTANELLHITDGARNAMVTGSVGNYHTGCELDTDKFFATYDTYGVVGTIANKITTLGTPLDMTYNIISSCKLDTDKFLNIYYDGVSKLRGQACTVSGTTITPGTAVDVDTTGLTRASVVQLATDKAMVIYYSATNTVKARVCTISGTTITWGAAVNVDTGAITGGWVDIAKVGTDNVVLSYQTTAGGFRAKACTISTTTITQGTDVQINANTTVNRQTITSYANGYFFTFYQQSASWITGGTTGFVSGTAITLGSEFIPIQNFGISDDIDFLYTRSTQNGYVSIFYERVFTSNPYCAMKAIKFDGLNPIIFSREFPEYSYERTWGDRLSLIPVSSSSDLILFNGPTRQPSDSGTYYQNLIVFEITEDNFNEVPATNNEIFISSNVISGGEYLSTSVGNQIIAFDQESPFYFSNAFGGTSRFHNSLSRNDQIISGSSRFNGDSQAWALCKTNNNRMVFAHYDNGANTYVQVCVWNGSEMLGSGADATILTGAPDFLHLIPLDTDKFMVFYIASGGTTLYARACTISGTTITLGTETTIATGIATHGYSRAIRKIDAIQVGIDTFAVMYPLTAGTAVTLEIGTVYDTTITQGTPVTVASAFGNQNNSQMGLAKIGTNKIVCLWESDGSVGPIQARAATISGTTPTLGSTYSLINTYSGGGLLAACASDGNDSFVVVYKDGINTDSTVTLQGFKCSVSGTVITRGYSTSRFYGPSSLIPRGMGISYIPETNRFVIFYNGGSGGSNVTIGEIKRLDTNYNYSNVNFSGRLYAGYRIAWSQSFNSGIGRKLSNVDVSIGSFGSPTGNVYLKLYAHTGTFGTTSKPTGPALAVSDPLSAINLPSAGKKLYGQHNGLTQVRFTFSGLNQYEMQSNTNYCWVLEYNGGDSNNYIIIGFDNTSDGYNGNLAYTTNGSTWTTSSNDIPFNLFIDASASPTITVTEGLPQVFDANGIFAPDVCNVGNDVVVACYDDGTDLKVIAGTVSGTTVTWGTPVTFAAGVNYQAYPSICKVTTNKFAVGWSEVGSTGTMRVRCGTLSGTVITLGTEANVATGGTNNEIALAQVDASHFVVGMYNDTAGDHMRACSVSGTTITIGAATQIDASVAPAHIFPCYIENGKFAVAYNAASNYARLRIGTVSGTTITFGTAVATGAVDTTLTYVKRLSASQLVLSYRTSSNLVAKVGLISGYSITLSQETIIKAGAYVMKDVSSPSENLVLFTYFVSSNYYFRPAYVDGGVITLGDEVAYNGNYGYLIYGNESTGSTLGMKSILVYGDSTDANKGTSKVISFTYNPPIISGFKPKIIII